MKPKNILASFEIEANQGYADFDGPAQYHGFPVRLSVPLRAKSAGTSDSFQVRNAAGKVVRAVARPFVQWPDGSVRLLEVWLAADLPRGASHRYTLVRAGSSAKPAPQLPASETLELKDFVVVAARPSARRLASLSDPSGRGTANGSEPLCFTRVRLRCRGPYLLDGLSSVVCRKRVVGPDSVRGAKERYTPQGVTMVKTLRAASAQIKVTGDFETNTKRIAAGIPTRRRQVARQGDKSGAVAGIAAARRRPSRDRFPATRPGHRATPGSALDPARRRCVHDGTRGLLPSRRP